MAVGVEGVAVGNLRVDATDGKVHLRQAPSGVVGLLAVDGNVANLAAVGLDELLAADEHAPRSAARVIDAALVRRKHFDQHTDDTGRRIKLSTLLALSTGKLREEIFVDAAENILGAVCGAAETDVANERSRCLSRPTRAKSLGKTPLRDGLSRSMSPIASSMMVPIFGCGALARRNAQRAPFGTQKMRAAAYSSGSSGSAPCAFCASSSACFASNASEMYLRKIRPRTTCLYSAASMLLRSASAAAHSFDSKPRGVPFAKETPQDDRGGRRRIIAQRG